jgi:serine/threonine kinase 32
MSCIQLLFFEHFKFHPQTKHPNFDPSHELEEILLEDNPLKAKRRTKDVETLSPDMKKMEEQ